MSYTSIMNDGFNMKRQMDNGSLIIDPELKQGKALLRRRSKMQKSVRIRSKDLMKEGFTNMKGSNFQQAVVQQNNDEIQDLIGMQNAYDSTMEQWSGQYRNLVETIKAKPKEYTDCVTMCQKTNKKQALNACLYGCGIGKFTTNSAKWRGPQPNPPWAAALFAGIAVAALAVLALSCLPCLAGACEAAEVVADSAELGEAIEAGETAVEGAEEAEEGLMDLNKLRSALQAIKNAFQFGEDASEEAEVEEAGEEGEEGEEEAQEFNRMKKAMEDMKKLRDRLKQASRAFRDYIQRSLANEGEEVATDEEVDSAITTNGASGDAASGGESDTMQSLRNMWRSLKMPKANLSKFATNFMIGGVSGVATFAILMKTLNREDYTWGNATEQQKRSWIAWMLSQPGGQLNTSMGASPQDNKNLVYYHSSAKEAFTNPGSPPQPHSIASVSADGDIYSSVSNATNQMGSIGPAGWKNRNSEPTNNKNINQANINLRNQINTSLSSKPVHSASEIWGGSGPIESATDLSEMNNVNSAGIHAELEKTTKVFSSLLSGLQNDPLVKQMKSVQGNPEILSKGLNTLENKWKSIFKNACKSGIGSGSNFAGHKQYCESWTNTSNGRSGIYGDNYIVDPTGSIKESVWDGSDIGFVGTTTKLHNVTTVGSDDDRSAGRFGCDVAIEGTMQNGIGGSGYCTCVDGTKIYMDTGHPTISCNDLCNPVNVRDAGSKNLFYHNPNNWMPSIVPPDAKYKQGVKAFNQTSGTKDTPWLQCGDGSGEPDGCPDGMTQYGNVEPNKNCGQYDDDTGFLGIHWPWMKKNMKTIKGRRCVLPLPKGGNITQKGPGGGNMIDNGMGLQIPKGYKKLPSPTELIDTCSDVKYANLYIEILKFRVLDAILDAKTEIMGKAIDNASKGINKVKLQQSAVGRKLLRDMQKYKKTYDAFQKNSQRKNQLAGMYEDINFKSQSANISYYIWFILAISGMFLVIKKLKSSN